MATPKTPQASNLTKTVHKAEKSSQSLVGAPSQHKQGSRKSKRAWRKHVDIEDVEAGLEDLRAEERVSGTILQKKRDEELFQIDVKGDEKIRTSLPRLPKSLLTSTKIISQRSAVPAVFSRATSTSTHKPLTTLSRDEKSRLLRIGKRLRKGPLNNVMDPREFASGSAVLGLSEAVKQSGGYDPWTSTDSEEEPDENGFKPPKKRKVKAPTLPHPRDVIELPAIVEPHQGTSYNPPASAHQELLLKAHSIEERRLNEANKLAAVKVNIEQEWQKEAENVKEGVAPGMMVDLVQSETDDNEIDGDGDVRVSNKPPERKTKQQRNKAARLLAEKRALAEKATKKRLLATIDSVKVLRHRANQAIATREKSLISRQLALQEKAKRGLVGQRLGKHKVPESEIDVQLGEELSESLRGLKPEGNLFRDRFLSLQQRALVEPRVPVLPKKRSTRTRQYEKHAWKRFE